MILILDTCIDMAKISISSSLRKQLHETAFSPVMHQQYRSAHSRCQRYCHDECIVYNRLSAVGRSASEYHVRYVPSLTVFGKIRLFSRFLASVYNYSAVHCFAVSDTF